MKHQHIVVVLHNVRSAHNVGSIFRTADAAGIGRIFCAGITPSPIDRFGRPRTDIAKVALGAEQTIPWEAVRSTGALLRRLARDGYTILALEQDTRSVPHTMPGLVPKAGRACLVLGDEVRGLPRSIMDAADRIVEIPMRGTKESLNVAVAFGIAAYALRPWRGIETARRNSLRAVHGKPKRD